jgi:hypothetical protein
MKQLIAMIPKSPNKELIKDIMGAPVGDSDFSLLVQ